MSPKESVESKVVGKVSLPKENTNYNDVERDTEPFKKIENICKMYNLKGHEEMAKKTQVTYTDYESFRRDLKLKEESGWSSEWELHPEGSAYLKPRYPKYSLEEADLKSDEILTLLKLCENFTFYTSDSDRYSAIGCHASTGGTSLYVNLNQLYLVFTEDTLSDKSTIKLGSKTYLISENNLRTAISFLNDFFNKHCSTLDKDSVVYRLIPKEEKKESILTKLLNYSLKLLGLYSDKSLEHYFNFEDKKVDVISVRP